MTFGAPGFFLLFVVVPIGVAAYCWWLLWRGRTRRTFGGVASEFATAKAALVLSPILLIAAITLSVVGAARPQSGKHESPAEQRGIEVVIVLDVSNSMLATDVSPNRLARAQEQILGLLKGAAGDRVGLVLFAGRPFVRSPLTSDTSALLRLVDGVDEERGLLDPGSDIGAAVNAAAALVDDPDVRSRVILIVSDGEDFGTAAEAAVASAARSGILVYAAGVGTAAGAPVIDIDASTGVLSTRVDPDSGDPVITRLDDAALRILAESTGGSYVDFGVDGRVDDLRRELSALDQTVFGEDEGTSRIERFQVFAALALVFADLELLMLATLRRRSAVAHPAAKLWPVVGATIFLAAVCGTTVADINQSANERYERGDYEAALELYRTAQALDTAPELYGNAANALNMLARHPEAIEEALRASTCARSDDACDPGTLARIEYGLGNHYVAAARFRDALDAYRRALLADSRDVDAKANFELAARLLTPTPVPAETRSAPQGTPTAGGDEGEPSGGDSDPQPGTPSALDRETPAPVEGGEPSPDPQRLTDQELERALAEALAGVEEVFTPEEASRLLDLLEEQNRRSIATDADNLIRPEQPDY